MTADATFGGRAALTHGRLLRLALPVTLSNISTPLLGVVNAAAIGRLGDATQLGAVALGAVIFDMLFWSFVFLRMGTAGLTAQAYGASDANELRNVWWRSTLIAAAIGLIIIILRTPIIEIGVAFMQPSAETAAFVRAYVGARIWSAPVTLMNYAVLGSLIGRARFDVGLGLQIAINIVNIALSLFFVSVSGWGVTGVAWASVIAETLGLAAGLFFQAQDGLMRALRWRDIFARERIWKTVTVNRDIFLRTLLLIAATAIFFRQGARSGDATLAANAVLHNFLAIGAFFLDGFATATEQIAGQSVGARDREGFNRAVRLGAIWCVGFGAAVSLLFATSGGALIDFISTNAEVRSTARAFLLFAALAPFAGALAFLFDGVFIGATWTRAMRDAMLVSFALGGLVYVAASPWGNSGLWLTFLAFLALRGLVQAALYSRLERATFASG
ncbi:MATE family efflux transporter [Terrarubrum flagellatum]|uniref:MATE family efflux transporter n=1 Tax=Terrirubrum flagellatum TaxID=2895980 RepID=UPI0031454170